MTYKDIIKMTIEEGYRGQDFTCNGICSKCGECCGSILPLDQEDLDKIVEYVLSNKIHSTSTVLVMQNKLQCPYYTGNKVKGCAIYPARPKICRFYKCDKKNITKEELMAMKDAVACNMWAIAKELDKDIKKLERKIESEKEKSRRK